MDISVGLRKIRRAVAGFSVIAILASLSITTAFAAFSDVKESDWFYSYVTDLVDQGVIDGTQAKFRGGDSLNRAEMAKIAVMIRAVDDADMVVPETPSFSDVKKTDWFYKYVETAKSLGIVSGDAGKTTFRPADSVNRAEATKFFVNAAELEEDTNGGPHFSDVKESDWFYNFVETSYNNSVVDGVSGKFMPANKINRAEMSKMASMALSPEARTTEGTGEEDTTTPDTTTPDTTTPVVEEKPAGGLTIAPSDSQVAAGTLADGTAFNPLFKVKFSAGADADIKVTKLKITRGGLIADTTIKLSAYDAAGKRHGGVIQVSSDHNAEIGMETDPIVVAKGTSTEVTIKANISAAANSSTLQLSLAAAADVTSTAVESKGTFPISGNSFSVVDGASSVAAATFDVRNESSTARNVDIGQKGYEITKFELIETSSKEDLNLKSLKLFNNGSTADGDLTNIVLKDQSGNVLATAAKTTDKYVTFTLEKPFFVGLGTTKLFTVEVDVVGGATRTAQFIVQNDFDVEITGASTGASILATAKAAGTDTSFPIGDLTTGNSGFNQISVNEGSLSVSKDNSSPSGDVTKGANDVILGTFKLQALGEDIELQRASIDLANGGDKTTTDNTTTTMECASAAASSPGTTCDLTGSVKLVTEDGKTLLTQTAATTALWNNTPAYSDLSSYYTIKAGDSKIVKIVANLSSGAGLGSGETITAGLRSLYYYKKSSLKYADSTTNGVTGTTVAANALTATTSSLTVSSNTAYGSQTMVVGTSNAKIASFVVKAGSAEGVSITNVTLKVDESVVASGNANITNLKLMKVTTTGETQLGTTQNSVTDNTNTSFSVSGFSLAANEQMIVNVYADIGSISNHTLTTTIAAAGVSGNAVQSATSTTAPTAALGLQVITGTTGGTLNVTAATDTPLANQWVAGTAGNDSLKIKLAATLAEDIYVKELTVRIDAEGDDIALSQATLVNTSASPEVNLGTVAWQQDTTAAGVAAGETANPGYATWTFSGSNRPKVPSNGVLYLTVRADTVSSQQVSTVTGLTPRLSVASIKSEGVGQISPLFSATATTRTVGATGPTDTAVDTANDTDSGCNFTAGGTAAATSFALDSCPAADNLAVGQVISYTNSTTEGMLITAITSPGTSPTITVTRGYEGAAVVVNAGGAVLYGKIGATAANNAIVLETDSGNWTAVSTVPVVGQVIQIGTEDMYVLTSTAIASQATERMLTVTRGVNGTTIAAAAINVQVGYWTAVTANEALVVKTKPTFTAASDSPSGVQSAGSNLLLAKFNVSADLNTADSAENAVILNKMDIKFNRTGVNLANLNLYPAAVDQNGTFAVSPQFWVSGNTARFNIGGNASLVAAGYNKIIEGSGGVKTFVIRGDITATAQGGTLTVQLGNIGAGTGGATTVSSAGAASTAAVTGLGVAAAVAGSLNAGDNAGDVEWTDGTTTFDWVKQGTATQVLFNATALSYSSASGTLDTTSPQISAVVLSNGTGTNNTANSIDSDIVCTGTAAAPTLVCDHMSITFNEAMDPTTINANLVPSGATTGTGDTLTVTSPAGITIGTTSTGMVTGSTGSGTITVANIVTIAATVATADVAVTAGTLGVEIIAIDSTGTVLKIYNIDVATDRAIGAPSASTGITTTLKDLNGRFLSATATTATGQF